jgi:hypothetical protein
MCKVILGRDRERYIKKVMLLYSGSKNPKVKLARIPLNSDFKK